MWISSGYENQKVFLENALNNKKYAHAYLFCGPDNASKLNLAKEFANNIFGLEGAKERERVNPDINIIGEEKLKIEDIRNLISELSLKPFNYQYKIAIIESFENVTPEAASSILKTLEEPSPTTILILLANNKLSVLPTIASRCQIIYFSPQTSPIGDDFIDRLAKESQAKKLLAIKDLADKESLDLQAMISDWIASEQTKMLQTDPRKFKNIQNLLEALQGLKQNFNKKLVLEKLFLNLV
jgi:DNA polymerase-3 subunit delta'